MRARARVVAALPVIALPAAAPAAAAPVAISTGQTLTLPTVG